VKKRDDDDIGDGENQEVVKVAGLEHSDTLLEEEKEDHIVFPISIVERDTTFLNTDDLLGILEDDENETESGSEDVEAKKEKARVLNKKGYNKISCISIEKKDYCDVLVQDIEDGVTKHSFKQKEEDLQAHDDCNEEVEKTTAVELIKSAEYILLILWFTIMLVPMQYYIGTIAFQLERKGDSDSNYLRYFSMFYASSALLSPALGKIADMAGLGVTQLIATVLITSSLFILTSSSLNFNLVGLVCYGIGRMAVFGMYFTNIGKRLGYTHYGTLAGLGLLISSVSSLLQYPLIDAAANGHEYVVNLISACVLLVTGVPYCIWLGTKERKDEDNQFI